MADGDGRVPVKQQVRQRLADAWATVPARMSAASSRRDSDFPGSEFPGSDFTG
jgi:hypothetical protein